jgi:diadenosine tetraphosphate (Ap4A) HIT family hydrolase
LIVKGEVPSHGVWQDADHMAFLSIFPNTEGVTVVITKKHFSSYIFELPDNEAQKLFMAAK